MNRFYTSIILSFLFPLLSPAPMAQSGQGSPPRFRAEVDTVLVRVSILDPLNRYVVGLQKEHFRIFDERVEQEIVHFSDEQAPVSVGFVLDTSGSMGTSILSARNSIIRFLGQGDAEDEYFLITFNERGTLVQDFTDRGENVKSALSVTGTKGRTALYDAIYLGLEKMRSGRHEKKALIVVTDGEDNSSRYSFSEVKEFARESDVQIYAIGERGNLGYGRAIINDIVRLSGGRAFFPNSFKQLDYFCDLIHTELRNQYLIGYHPSVQAFDGKWRRIQVRLDAPEGLPRLIVRSREGYFSPSR